jgi:hypothetical protein
MSSIQESLDKAFRPSKTIGFQDEEDRIELKKKKRHNIQFYADRALRGLPLFELTESV